MVVEQLNPKLKKVGPVSFGVSIDFIIAPHHEKLRRKSPKELGRRFSPMKQSESKVFETKTKRHRVSFTTRHWAKH